MVFVIRNGQLFAFYGIPIIIGYLMPNSVYTYILNVYDLVWFSVISTAIGYLIPNLVYTYISNILGFVWLGFMAYQPI